MQRAECYCGNPLSGPTLANGGIDPLQDQCDMKFDGNNRGYCGGPNRLNTYHYNASLASAFFAVSIVTGSATLSISGTSSIFGRTSLSTTTPTSVTTALAPTGPITVQQSVGFAFLGCYSDSVTLRPMLASAIWPAAETQLSTAVGRIGSISTFVWPWSHP